MKNKKSVFAVIALVLIVGIVLAISYFNMNSNAVEDEKLIVKVLKTGKSDAIFVRSGDKTMMIDVGKIKDAEKIVQFLHNENITTLDTIIITHFDKDHVGAAGMIVEEFNVGQVLVPDYEGLIPEYADFMNSMTAAQITPRHVSEQMNITLGNATVHIDPPINYDVNIIADAVDDYDNTLSLMTTITCGEKRFLFAADADRRRLNEWMENNDPQDIDFLKVPHHGSFNASLDALLAATTPEYAAITCSKKNPADDVTIETLQKHGVNVYQTRDGQITVITDGKNIKVIQD